jgi:hypothetical protein
MVVLEGKCIEQADRDELQVVNTWARVQEHIDYLVQFVDQTVD